MNRWVRLIGSVIAMAMIANFQYAWALFVKPMMGATGWKLSDVQWGFTLFIAFETWVQPFAGRFMDRLGPRIFMSVGAVMCGVGWVGMGKTHSLTGLYALYSLAGIGAALVYCGSTIVGLKWFPDKLGLASGLIAAGFGSGAALFVPFIAHIIRAENYRAAFLYTGIGQGIVILLVSQLMVNPDPNDPQIAGKKAQSKFKVRRQAEQFTSAEMLCTPQFYMLYAMMLMMGIGGPHGHGAGGLRRGHAGNQQSHIYAGDFRQFSCEWLGQDFLGLGVGSCGPRTDDDHRVPDPGAGPRQRSSFWAQLSLFVCHASRDGSIHLGRNLFALSRGHGGFFWNQTFGFQLCVHLQLQGSGIDPGGRTRGAAV